MQKGWCAKGLLTPWYAMFEDGRDGMAKAVGVPPSSLSRVNQGGSNLGETLARKITNGLNAALSDKLDAPVTLQDLGAPVGVEDGGRLTLAARVARLEEETEQFWGVIVKGFGLLDVDVVTPNGQQEPVVQRRERPRDRHAH